MNGSVKANEVLLLGQEHTGKSTFLQRIVETSNESKEMKFKLIKQQE